MCGITPVLQGLAVVKASLLEFLELFWRSTPFTTGVCPDFHDDTSLVVSYDEQSVTEPFFLG